MPNDLNDSVVVITGASSGIGRAAALAFAKNGARVVLSARDEQALREASAECESAGARTVVVPADVTDEQAVEQLAVRAVEEFGRIDVWVNNESVQLVGRFEDAPRRTRTVASSRRTCSVTSTGHAPPYFGSDDRATAPSSTSPQSRERRGFLTSAPTPPRSLASSGSQKRYGKNWRIRVFTSAPSCPRVSTHRYFTTPPTTRAAKSSRSRRSTHRKTSPRPSLRAPRTRSGRSSWDRTARTPTGYTHWHQPFTSVSREDRPRRKCSNRPQRRSSAATYSGRRRSGIGYTDAGPRPSKDGAATWPQPHWR